MFVVEINSIGADILCIRAPRENFVVRLRLGVSVTVSELLAWRLVVKALERDILRNVYSIEMCSVAIDQQDVQTDSMTWGDVYPTGCG